MKTLAYVQFLKLNIFFMNSANFHLAELNIAELKHPMDSPELADFVANIGRSNQLAENHLGFIWRLVEDTELLFDPDHFLVNMSVWETPESLKAFTYETAHVEIMRQRKKWFEHMKNNYFVMWWNPKGHIPTLKEGKEKLEYLDQQGPSPAAFTYSQIFQPQL